MQLLFLCYEKCSTCQKAKRFLNTNHISYHERDIIKENPTVEELTNWLREYNLPYRKLFNTSGKLYRELNLKERLPKLSKDNQIELLASSGYLIKRPLVIYQGKIISGFNEKIYQEIFVKSSK